MNKSSDSSEIIKFHLRKNTILLYVNNIYLDLFMFIHVSVSVH